MSTPARNSGGHAPRASSPSSGPTLTSEDGASTISAGGPGSKSSAAAVGQKCESETKVPRASIRTERGNIRHDTGSASCPPARWIRHRLSLSKKTHAPLSDFDRDSLCLIQRSEEHTSEL